MAADFRYEAFISYSQRADALRATGLQKVLERLARPWYRARSMRVFRDDTDIAVAPSLEAEINRALSQSAHLIVLASPESAESPWVEKEIRWWLQHRALDELLLVKTGGEIVWDDDHADFHHSRTTAVPSSLFGRYASEPFYVDLQPFEDAVHLDPRNPTFRAAALKIAARLRRKAPADLESDDLRQLRRNRTWATGAFLATLIAAGVAMFQWQLAEERALRIEQEAMRARSNELAALARSLVNTPDADLAFVLALKAIKTDPRNLESTWAARQVITSHHIDRVFRDGESAVLHALFDPEDKQLVTAYADGMLRIWDRTTGTVVQRLSGHSAAVYQAKFSHDGRWLLTASEDKTARVWQASDGREQVVLQGHLSDVLDASFGPDGELIATASRDHTARLWQRNGGIQLNELGGHPGEVRQVVFSPDGKSLLTTSEGDAFLWDVETGKKRFGLPRQSGDINAAAFSPDGRLILTADDSGEVSLWNSIDGTRQRSLAGHAAAVYAAEFSRDGQLVATAGRDGRALVFDAGSGQRIAEVRTVSNDHGLSQVSNASFSPDGTLLLTVHQDDVARLWRIDDQSMVAAFRGHQGPLSAACFSRDGHHVLTGSHDGAVRLWRIADADVVVDLPLPDETPLRLGFDATGRKLVVIGPRSIQSWELADQSRLYKSSVENPRITELGELAELAVYGYWDGTVVVRGGDDGQVRFRTRVGHDEVTAADILPNGLLIVAASGTEVGVVDVASGRVITRLVGHSDWIEAVSLSPDGQRVVTAGQDRRALVWHTGTGELLFELKGHADAIVAADYSRDGTRIITADVAGQAKLWNASNGALLFALDGHQAAVSGAIIGPRMQLAATAGMDGTTRTWDLETGQLVAQLRVSGYLRALRFSPDGRFLLTSSRSGPDMLYDAYSGRPLLEFDGRDDGRTAAAFDPSGILLATMTASGDVRVWDLSLAQATAAQLVERMEDTMHSLRVQMTPGQCQLYFSSPIGARPQECDDATVAGQGRRPDRIRQ